MQQENTTPKTPETEEEEKKKKRFFFWWWILLLLILLISVGVIVWALFLRAPKTDNTPRSRLCPTPGGTARSALRRGNKQA